MKTKASSPKKEQPKPEAAKEQAVPAPVPILDGSEEVANFRLRFVNGKPELLAGMRDKTKEQLRTVLSDPKILAELGIKEVQKGTVEVISAQVCGQIYDVLGTVEAFLCERFYNAPHDVAVKCFTYTEGEKAVLAPPTAAVINKYATDWMIRFKEEIALFMLFTAITSVKIASVKMLTAKPQLVPKRPDPTPINADEKKDALAATPSGEPGAEKPN